MVLADGGLWGGADLPRGSALCRTLTVLEDPLHVQAVGGAGFVVCAAFQVIGKFSGPAIVDHPRVGGADGV